MGSRIVVKFYSTYVSRHNFFVFISGLIIESHIELMSMLGWLITWSVQWMNADSSNFLILEFSSFLLCLLCPIGICVSVPMSVPLWIYLLPHEHKQNTTNGEIDKSKIAGTLMGTETQIPVGQSKHNK